MLSVGFINRTDIHSIPNVLSKLIHGKTILVPDMFYSRITRCNTTSLTFDDFIPELDFVIEVNGEIIANIMYTKAKLIEHSFAKAIELGYDTVVIFGNPNNYVSRGFKSCIKYNVCLKGDIFPTALLVKELHDGALDGRKWHFYESSVMNLIGDKEKLERFDAEFPFKIKDWKPSQEEFFIHSHSVIR